MKKYDIAVANEEIEYKETGAFRRTAIDDEIADSTTMAGQTAAMITKEQIFR